MYMQVFGRCQGRRRTKRNPASEETETVRAAVASPPRASQFRQSAPVTSTAAFAYGTHSRTVSPRHAGDVGPGPLAARRRLDRPPPGRAHRMDHGSIPTLKASASLKAETQRDTPPVKMCPQGAKPARWSVWRLAMFLG